MNLSGASEASRSGRERWVGIVANAASGLGRGRMRVARLVETLALEGLPARIAWTPEERRALVDQANADPNARCLVAAGGDGTIAALLNERPGVPVTVLPAGTENLFARHFGMSHDPEQVAATIARGRTIRMDLGSAPGRRFALMAGIGFDADVVTRHHLARVGQAGRMRPTHRAAYVEPVLRSSFAYRFPPLTLRIDDPGAEETVVGSLAFLFNLPCYALGLPIAPLAREDDGLLDLVVFRDPGPFQALRYLWLVFRGIHLRKPGVTHRKIRRVSITAAEPVPVQLDGDPGGLVADPGAHITWGAEVLPGAVGVIVPDSYRLARAS